MVYFVPEASAEEIKKERARARDLRASQWWKRRRSSGVCHFCGRAFRPAELTMEHIVPLIRGGKSTKGNVVPACRECNSKKKYLLPSEWEEYLERIRNEPG
jgi:5-methylcytosine-specific restriction endonuclease McrA